MPTYILGARDISYGLQLGVARIVDSHLTGAQPVLKQKAAPEDVDGYLCDINGALGEVAVALYLGLPVPPPSSIRNYHSRPDIEPDVEARWRSITEDRPKPDLYIRANDVLTRRFVLVTGHDGKYEMVGWIKGTEVQKHHRTSYGNGFYVPQHDLHLFTDWLPPGYPQPVNNYGLDAGQTEVLPDTHVRSPLTPVSGSP